jgi:hypothetical protein
MITGRDTFDDARLEILLSGDEASDAHQSAAAHVETCAACQQRLTELAGDEKIWDRVADSLADDPFAAEAYLSSADGDPDVHAVTGDSHHLDELLDAPSHPEMLGRLGRYEIERVIGAGGMGVVLRGFDTELNRPVAIKVLARHLAHSGAARQRFAREARAAAAVVHEHVVAIHNVETAAETPFLVMQYVAGESLQARVDRDGPLETKEILRIGCQAAAGLHAAHAQGVIHRDIKPANILLEHGVERALVTDFGLARTVDDASLTHTGVVTGTPHYMSPEQANGRPADQRTDLFSLGSVLYFMATGRPPFRAERAMGVLHRICQDRHRPAWEINPDIPDELSDIIDALLQKQPERRIATAAELQRRLTELLARMQQRRIGRRPRLVRLARRHRTGIGAGVAGIGLALIGGWRLAASLSQPSADVVSRETIGGWSAQASPTAKKFTASAWHQASAREAEDFADAVNVVNDALSQLEATTFAPPPPQSAETAWQEDIHSLHERLDRLEEFQDETFTPSTARH